MSYRQDSGGESSSSDCDYSYINYADNRQSDSTPKQHGDHFNESNLLNVPVPGDRLWDISEYICGNWKGIGRRLYIQETVIEAIDIDYDEDGNKEKAYQMLLTWKRQMGNSATVQRLGNVLKKIGRTDTAEIIFSLIDKKLSPSSEPVRTKTEIESHIKLQKLALQKLSHCVKFYKKKVNEISDLSDRVLQLEKASELEEKLGELNDMKNIQNTLDHLQMELKGMQDQNKGYAELGKKFRDVLEKLCKVEQTVVQYEEILDDSPLIQCKFQCYFRVNLPRRSIHKDERRKPAKLEKESDDDDVFESPNQVLSKPAARKPEPIKPTEQSRDRHVRFSGCSRAQERRNVYRRSIPRKRLRDSEEMHVRRRFNVSALSMDEQFQMEEFLSSISPRKCHEEKPFVFTHSCISQYLQQCEDGSDMDICPITEYFYPSPYKHSIETWYI